MRSLFWGSLLLSFAIATLSAQETNFANGPQYLVTSGSSTFARSIATPTMSLAGPPPAVGASDATGVLSPGGQDQTVTPPRAVALPAIDLFPIYYGDRPVGATQIGFPVASAATPASIETPAPAALPPSIFDTGVWRIPTTRAPRDQGYGISLAQAAAHQKVRSRQATHVYTNSDIEKLHQGS